MELALNNKFTELSKDEMVVVGGGFFGPTLFAIWGVKVTVGHALSAGVALGGLALATN
jgi:hypothetical protein